MLTLAAVIPPIYLLFLIYRMDKIEKEPMGLVLKLFLLGALSTIPAGFIEAFASSFLNGKLPESSFLYQVIMFFVIVAWTEEGVKHIALKHGSYKSPHFNFSFDAIVYSTAAALGFAAAENIGYVDIYGFNVAIGRALTAIPAHCIFGIFMGYFYGLARFHQNLGNRLSAKSAQRMSLLAPIILHGIYDILASGKSDLSTTLFLIFIVVLDIISIVMIRGLAKNDQPVG